MTMIHIHGHLVELSTLPAHVLSVRANVELAMGAGATYYLHECFGFDERVKPLAVIRDTTVSALPRP